jgi:hypothetical protein
MSKKVYYIFLFHIVVMFCMLIIFVTLILCLLRHCVIIFKDICFQFE